MKSNERNNKSNSSHNKHDKKDKNSIYNNRKKIIMIMATTQPLKRIMNMKTMTTVNIKIQTISNEEAIILSKIKETDKSNDNNSNNSNSNKGTYKSN